MLREPDVRLFVKAYNRKKAGLAQMGWHDLIDTHVDDALGLAVRRLMDDRSFKSNTARADAFKTETGADRATFYRRLARNQAASPPRQSPRGSY